MLRTVTRIRGAKVRAIDGDAGHVEEFVFDDDTWTIRYLVVDTGSWLMHRPLLIPPMSIEPQWTVAELPTRLTKDQLRRSPLVESHKTVSRQDEAQLLEHYGHQPYWNGDTSSANQTPAVERPRIKPGDERLCGMKEVTGFHVRASDCEIGHVNDFLIDDDSWRIEYLLVDASYWVETKSVLIPPTALRGIDWSTSKMKVALSEDSFRHSPSPDVGPVAPRADSPHRLG